MAHRRHITPAKGEGWNEKASGAKRGSHHDTQAAA